MPSHSETIASVAGSLERLEAMTDFPLRGLIESCRRSVSSSARRVDIGGVRLTRAALNSISAAAAFPVWTYISCSARSRALDAEFRRLFNLAVATSGSCAAPRPVDGAPWMAAPDGWQEHQAGVFRTVMGGRTAEIVYSPHMPGGDWAAWISGVPVVRAVDPEAAASRVRRVIEFIEDDRPEPRPLQRFGLR